MSLIDEMQNLREGIENATRIRHQRIQEIKKELSAFRKDATKARREDFKVLTQEVNQFIGDLKKEVIDLKKGTKLTQRENQAKQRELKDMLAEARAAFWGKKVKTKKAADEGGE